MQISATDILSDSHSLTGTLHACVFGFIDGAVGLGFQSVNARDGAAACCTAVSIDGAAGNSNVKEQTVDCCFAELCEVVVL